MKPTKYNEVASKYDEQIRAEKQRLSLVSDNPEFEAQEWNDSLSAEIDYIIPFTGIAQDIQAWILEKSLYPQPAISFAAVMSILCVLKGRYNSYENIKGNLMFICMAESGEGKDWPFKAIKLILDAIGKAAIVRDGKHASGAALMESIQDTPSMILLIDEFGNYMANINGKNANQYSKEIIDIMTEAYTCSNSKLVGKVLKGKQPIIVTEPNLCVFGLSTERQIFDGLKTSDLANGSLARYSILFGVNGQLPRRIKYNDTVPNHIVSELVKMLDEMPDERFFKRSHQINRSSEYEDYKHDMTTRIKEMANNLEGERRNFIPMYNRVAVRCIQHAMLIDNCQSIEVLKWIEGIELKSVEIFCKKFLHLGSDNENEKLKKIIENAIKTSGKKGITKNHLYNKTRCVDSGMKNRIINELIDCGKVFCIEQKAIKPGPVPKIYYWKK
jgi:hypothetical protein